MTFPLIKFTDIVQDKSGGNKKLPQEFFLIDGQYPVVDQSKKFIAGYINDQEYLVKSTGLPVVIFGDHTKAIKFVDFPFAMGADGVKVLKPKDECDTKYLYHYLRYAKIPDAGYSRHFKFLKELEIPLPPLAEQRRIASILDQADAVRQKRQQALEKLDQLLQATFIDMFGDPVSNPNNYKQVELDNFILVGPQNGLYKPANMYGQGTPIVRIDGFKSGDIIDNKEFKRLSLEESDIEKYKLNKFDLVINRVNSPEYIGKTALIRNLEESTVFESNMMRFAVDSSKLNTYYLLFFLKQQFVLNQIANKRKDAVNQSSINQQDVKSLIINVPPIDSQIAFSNFFQKLEKNRNLFKQQVLNFDNLFKALQNQAFNGTL
ncbi:restriction endonuclease subunit S [Acinetobacter towneri]|uniref:restriction endonuclease subunit S n=1 Tax=Acinetobacter towneri TaxID=202956 RepID=UPI003A8B6488